MTTYKTSLRCKLETSKNSIAARKSACKVKSKIYKIEIRRILTYTADRIGKIADRTLMNRKRSEEIRRRCKIDNIIQCILQRKKNWYEHISRMNDDRIFQRSRGANHQ